MIDNYRPPFWALNGFIETVIPPLFRSPPQLNFSKTIFQLPDDDVIQLNWLTGHHKTLVVIIPGLGSGATSSYLVNVASYLNRQQNDVLIPDHRGLGIPNQKLRSYHAGNTEDLKAILDSKEIQSYEKVMLIGFSLGGNIVLKYLGEVRKDTIINKAVAICTPFNLAWSSKVLMKPQNMLFHYRFLKSLKQHVIRKARQYPESLSIALAHSIKNIWALDDIYTAPVHGFKDAARYYDSCSSQRFIPSIQAPTLIINALNDPLIPVDSATQKLIQDNPHIISIFTKRGGHVGYPSMPLNKVNWFEKRIAAFFAATEENH